MKNATMKSKCKNCGKEIYWSDVLKIYRHQSLIDNKRCDGIELEKPFLPIPDSHPATMKSKCSQTKHEFMTKKEFHCEKCWHINLAYATSKDYCDNENCICHQEQKVPCPNFGLSECKLKGCPTHDPDWLAKKLDDVFNPRVFRCGKCGASYPAYCKCEKPMVDIEDRARIQFLAIDAAARKEGYEKGLHETAIKMDESFSEAMKGTDEASSLVRKAIEDKAFSEGVESFKKRAMEAIEKVLGKPCECKGEWNCEQCRYFSAWKTFENTINSLPLSDKN